MNPLKKTLVELPFASLRDSDVVIEPLTTDRTFSAREGQTRCLNGFFGVELSQEMAKTLECPEKVGAFVSVVHKPRPLNIRRVAELEEQRADQIALLPDSERFSLNTDGHSHAKTPLCTRSKFIL